MMVTADRPSPTRRDTTGPMSREEMAHADGQAMGRALAGRPATERAAWWAGLTDVLGGASTYRGLPAPPDGWQWAEAGRHALTGTVGLCHLIRALSSGEQGPDRFAARVAVCGHEEPVWITVGRWETERREACPGCAGQRVTA